MASIRSISASKPPDNLSARRLNRSSIAVTPHTQKKSAISKSPSTIISTTRQKSSRMSLKKDPIVPTTSATRLHSSSDSHDLTSEQMASLKLQDSSPGRSRSYTTNHSASRLNSDMEKSYDEQQNDRSASSSASYKSSNDNQQFTLESFDTVRTVGTGRIFLLKQNLSIEFSFRNIRSCSSCLQSRYEDILRPEKHVN